MIIDTTKPPAEAAAQAPPQFTLRQALIAIGALCVVLALYRAAGPELATGLLVTTVLFGLFVWGVVRRDWILAAFPVVLFVCGYCLLMPAVGSRTPSKRLMCANNLRQIAIALQTYHDLYGTFPPPYIADEKGRPMHSWRVLLLADLDPSAFQQYRFDEPWDGPNNSKLKRYGLPFIRCPAEFTEAKDPLTETSYVVVVGPKTAFPGDKCIALSDITDDHGSTILVVEVANSGIHWMEPRDLHVTQMNPRVNPTSGHGISSKHSRGANVAMADGSVRFLEAEKVTPEELQALLSIDGGEDVSDQ